MRRFARGQAHAAEGEPVGVVECHAVAAHQIVGTVGVGTVADIEGVGEASGEDAHVGELGGAWVKHDGGGAVGHVHGEVVLLGTVGEARQQLSAGEEARLLGGNGVVE